MSELFSLVEKYGTDKTLSGYTYTYSDLFIPIKNDVKSVLEIGLGTLNPAIPSTFAGNTQHFSYYKPGGSLRVWRDFFTNANVYGVDIAKDCMFKEDRIETFLFDSSEKEYVEYYLDSLEFDVIIDDGNHDPKFQIKTLRNLLPKLKNGGYYIIEDIGGYSGTEELLIDYLDEFNTLTKDYVITNKGNHIVIHKQKIVPFTKKDYTLVTGLWNIGRNGRGFEEHYLPNLEKFLEIDAPLVIFVPSTLTDFVKSRRNSKNTHVVTYELEDIKKIYSPFWDRTQKIRLDSNWYNQTGEHGWLKNSPQALLEWYNPIVQSKMFLLHDASIWNPFETEYFYWLDAGIMNTVSHDHLVNKKALDGITKLTEPFLFLSYPYESSGEIHGFNFEAMNLYAGQKVKYVCRGGLFGGHKDVLSYTNGMYYTLLDKTLSQGYMGTEESIFSLMSYIEPEKYRRYSLDGNGLISKFTSALIEKKAELEHIPDNKVYIKPKNLDTSKLKTSLYILTFNFPSQVRHTLETYKKNQPDFLDKTVKILIDNSNKIEAVEENKKLCEEYNFEHIVTGENLGINRGRQFAAEHFHKSDSDYYIFLEDDMGIYGADTIESKYCRNGFRHYIPNLFNIIHKIMIKEEYDFLKLSYTEVYMDNNIQVSWYNVPQHIRTEIWPEYDRLPVQGLDPDAPRTKFNKIDVLDNLSYIDGEIYYANWPMIVGKTGNKKMFIDTKWDYPYEQTWMSYMFQETHKGNIKAAVLLASPINHDRILWYKPEERREN
jgi:hypothetical protein